MLCVRKTVKIWAVLIMRTKLFDTDNDFILIAFLYHHKPLIQNLTKLIWIKKHWLYNKLSLNYTVKFYPIIQLFSAWGLFTTVGTPTIFMGFAHIFCLIYLQNFSADFFDLVGKHRGYNCNLCVHKGGTILIWVYIKGVQF